MMRSQRLYDMRFLSATTLLLLVCPSLAFTSPRQQQRSPGSRFSLQQLDASLQHGDTILILGGTSGVGQLVSRKLCNRQGIHVRISARNPTKARELFDDNDAIQIVPVDLTGDDIDGQLDAALKDVSAVVISVGTTAFPSPKWQGGNTPAAIDDAAVTKIAKAAGRVGSSSLKKIVLLTSIGVERANTMPFAILNLFGVLDAKRSGEDAIKASALEHGFEYALVRPGRLVGGPFTNLDFPKLLQLQGGAENGVDLARGDSLIGDCKRDACAEAVVQCLTNDACSNMEFCMVSNEQTALNDEQWTSAFLNLRA